jgi:phosphate starvation-inducible PhoH-like protein
LAEVETFIDLSEADPRVLLGSEDRNLRLIEKTFPTVNVVARGGKLSLKGDRLEVDQVHVLVESLLRTIERSGKLAPVDVETALMSAIDPRSEVLPGGGNVILTTPSGDVVRAKTTNQRELVNEARDKDIVFAVGPAGTGKTFTAVAIAVSMLKARKVKKIILCRPAVEAGEKLGFLPGDLKEKVDPYLRPLYDALEVMLPREKLNNGMEQHTIEIAPLAYMRGRTLSEAFVILDEAQNATRQQMKMFLTRIGVQSRAIITGDVTQIDLPRKSDSGLVEAQQILSGIPGIGFVTFNAGDVVRHRLVRQIIRAYEHADELAQSTTAARNG